MEKQAEQQFTELMHKKGIKDFKIFFMNEINVMAKAKTKQGHYVYITSRIYDGEVLPPFIEMDYSVIEKLGLC